MEQFSLPVIHVLVMFDWAVARARALTLSEKRDTVLHTQIFLIMVW